MDDYKELYDSLAKACTVLEEENKKMMRELAVYEARARQWEIEKASQMAIIQSLLTQKNKEHNEILEENQRLNQQIRELKDSGI